MWTGQEPGWDSPINRGSHCCKGAAVRDDAERTAAALSDQAGERQVDPNLLGSGDRRDRRQVDGDTREVRSRVGNWLGSAKFTNEAAYLNRKFAAFWGTNNSDHQARICHSTTVAGVATWGYGAMTNSYNDIRNARTIMVMGGNPAEAHPVSLQHILEGKELNRANMIVIDPRMTRTAAHATEYVRVRPGTHIPTIYGMLWHIFQNGWEDKEFIRQRVYGMDDIRKEVAKWPPDEVERVTGLPEAQVKRVAEIFREATSVNADLGYGADPVHGRNGERAHQLHPAARHRQCRSLRQRCQHLPRTHQRPGRNRRRPRCDDLPLYYGLDEGAWRHWCRVWEVDYDWMLSRFVDKTFMQTPGIPSTRWFDATLLPKDQVAQPDTMKAMFIMGHGGNHRRVCRKRPGASRSSISWSCDPYPTTWSVLSERKNGTYLLPPVPVSRWMGHEPRPTVRCNGASRSSSRSSNRRTTMT